MDDGVTNVERAAEAVGDDTAWISKRDINSGSTFWSGLEIDRRETKTVGARSQGNPTLTGDYRSGKFLSTRC